jgi:hypothetical protein
MEVRLEIKLSSLPIELGSEQYPVQVLAPDGSHPPFDKRMREWHARNGLDFVSGRETPGLKKVISEGARW